MANDLSYIGCFKLNSSYFVSLHSSLQSADVSNGVCSGTCYNELQGIYGLTDGDGSSGAGQGPTCGCVGLVPGQAPLSDTECQASCRDYNSDRCGSSPTIWSIHYSNFTGPGPRPATPSPTNSPSHGSNQMKSAVIVAIVVPIVIVVVVCICIFFWFKHRSRTRAKRRMEEAMSSERKCRGGSKTATSSMARGLSRLSRTSGEKEFLQESDLLESAIAADRRTQASHPSARSVASRRRSGSADGVARRTRNGADRSSRRRISSSTTRNGSVGSASAPALPPPARSRSRASGSVVTAAEPASVSITDDGPITSRNDDDGARARRQRPGRSRSTGSQSALGLAFTPAGHNSAAKEEERKVRGNSLSEKPASRILLERQDSAVSPLGGWTSSPFATMPSRKVLQKQQQQGKRPSSMFIIPAATGSGGGHSRRGSRLSLPGLRNTAGPEPTEDGEFPQVTTKLKKTYGVGAGEDEDDLNELGQRDGIPGGDAASDLGWDNGGRGGSSIGHSQTHGYSQSGHDVLGSSNHGHGQNFPRFERHSDHGHYQSSWHGGALPHTVLPQLPPGAWSGGLPRGMPLPPAAGSFYYSPYPAPFLYGAPPSAWPARFPTHMAPADQQTPLRRNQTWHSGLALAPTSTPTPMPSGGQTEGSSSGHSSSGPGIFPTRSHSTPLLSQSAPLLPHSDLGHGASGLSAGQPQQSSGYYPIQGVGLPSSPSSPAPSPNLPLLAPTRSSPETFDQGLSSNLEEYNALRSFNYPQHLHTNKPQPTPGHVRPFSVDEQSGLIDQPRSPKRPVKASTTTKDEHPPPPAGKGPSVAQTIRAAPKAFFSLLRSSPPDHQQQPPPGLKPVLPRQPSHNPTLSSENSISSSTRRNERPLRVRNTVDETASQTSGSIKRSSKNHGDFRKEEMPKRIASDATLPALRRISSIGSIRPPV